MTTLLLAMDETGDNEPQEGWVFDNESISVRISNPNRENGGDHESGPLSFFNSARITTDPEHDSIHFAFSIGDPRGCLVMTIRRRPDTGAVIIHLPHPGETMAHVETRELHPGTLEIGQWVKWVDGDNPTRSSVANRQLKGRPVEEWVPSDYSDPRICHGEECEEPLEGEDDLCSDCLNAEGF